MTHYQFLEPLTFKNGLILKNRIVMSPMTTMTSFYNGMVTSDEIHYYQTRAAGPAGDHWRGQCQCQR
ncbi:putative NADH-dependent flavin oxidoreductase [Agrilactobacillus composti DSM 18527 = JCM 14202]|nr:putative NADH-dependent flavin oxidoreductase [Agrilactobacillus composti DSM 18527 = JCM 14202]